MCSNDIISKSKQCLQTSCFLFCVFHNDVLETCRVRNSEEPSTDSVVNYVSQIPEVVLAVSEPSRDWVSFQSTEGESLTRIYH